MNKHKAQSTLEYAVVFAIVAAALMAMGTYMRRGAQATIRDFSDRIADQKDAEKKTNPLEEETSSQTATDVSSENSIVREEVGGGSTATTVSSDSTVVGGLGGGVISRSHSVILKGKE